jgi:hypothetical protein
MSFNHDKEARDIRDENLTEHLDNCYEIYRQKELVKISQVQSSMKKYDYETVLDLREQINDIYYDIENISYETIMKLYPRVILS